MKNTNQKTQPKSDLNQPQQPLKPKNTNNTKQPQTHTQKPTKLQIPTLKHNNQNPKPKITTHEKH